MYQVDQQDVVIQLSDAPQPDVGAPVPLVVADDNQLLVSYIVLTPEQNWDGTHVSVIAPDTQEKIALVKFLRPYAHMFGPPNDEAFHGHPLASRGLRPYGVFEIQSSSWIRQLERMNAVHPYHNRERFLATRRHFIFTFHDSTFECVAQGYEFEIFPGSIRSALDRMTAVLAQKWA